MSPTVVIVNGRRVSTLNETSATVPEQDLDTKASSVGDGTYCEKEVSLSVVLAKGGLTGKFTTAPRRDGGKSIFYIYYKNIFYNNCIFINEFK